MEEEIKQPEEIKKRGRIPTYHGEQRLIYKRGYDLGFRTCKRIKERMEKAKVFVQALHNLFKESGEKKK